jgi:xylulokinase
MIRAILEGITFETRSCFEELEKTGIKIMDVRAVGGGAKSPFWLQLKANVTKRRITTSKSTMPGTVGAAILAGIGIGEFSDAFEGVQRIYKEASTYIPEDEESRIYDEYYERYKYLRSTLKKTLA